MSIATFSNELKIFSYGDNFSLSASTQIRNEGVDFGRIAWSGDAKWITVTPLTTNNGPLPVYKFKDNELVPLKYVTLTKITSASFFNWTNKNIAVGSEAGHVYVWDLKAKKVSTTVDVKESHSIDHVCVSNDDEYIASASLNSAKVCLHSLVSNKVVNTFSIPQSEHTSSLKFCPCKKSYLAGSSTESTICVWDVVRSQMVFKSLSSHHGACTDISFSPINYSLIASVSMTKTLKMYDIREKSSVFEANMEEPLLCVDMISNGDKVVTGSSNGSVTIYDLRNNKMYKKLEAHKSPVLSVKMQVMKLSQSYREIEMNTPDVIEQQSKTLDISIMDVFSPINRVSGNKLSLSKSVSFHSTPKVTESFNDSGSCNNDSFLSKFVSPKREILRSTPKNEENKSISIHLGTLPEEPGDEEEELDSSERQSDDSNETTCGDGVHNVEQIHPGSLNQFLTDIKGMFQEQQKTLNEISAKIALIEQNQKSLKLDIESKYQIMQQNYDNLLEFLLKGIKQEVEFGNQDGKLEHICIRHLLSDIRDVVCEKSDQTLNEINNYVQKVNLIHKTLFERKAI